MTKRAISKLVVSGIRWGCLALLVMCTSASAVLIDFQTEDDFSTPLVNGQSISTAPDIQDLKGNPDTVFEFGNLLNIRTTPLSVNVHEGAAIFDSTTGVNPQDPDLQVNLGNILILQNDSHPATTLDGTYGLLFNTPNDERDVQDAGSIIFDFLSPVELTSIDVVDIDNGANLTLTLTDSSGNQRVYDVPSGWTTDVTVSGDGWETLYLNTLAAQPADGSGGDATVTLNQPGFDAQDVVQLEVYFGGGPTSAGIDNLNFVPEPATIALFGFGIVTLFGRKKA